MGTIMSFADFFTDWFNARAFAMGQNPIGSTIGIAMILNLVLNPLLLGLHCPDRNIYSGLSWLFPGWPQPFVSFTYALLSPVLNVYEELYYGIDLTKKTSKLWKAMEASNTSKEVFSKVVYLDKDEDLAKKDSMNASALRDTAIEYYDSLNKLYRRRSQTISVESWVQLSLQSSLLIHQYYYPPMGAILYKDDTFLRQRFSASWIWMAQVSVQLIGAILSAVRIYKGILSQVQYNCYIERGQHLGFMESISSVYFITMYTAASSFTLFSE